jgi:PAS domain S-box-containing protein
MVQVLSSGVESRPPPASSETSALHSLASLLVRHRSVLSCLGWLICALAAATLLRIGAGLFTGGVPLVFYLPAVMVVTLFAGWETGVAALILGTLLAWFLFVPPIFSWHLPNHAETITLVLWGCICGTQIAIAYALRLALQRVVQSETRYRRLLQAASGTVWVMNERGEVHTPQPGWSELTGMSWPEYQERGWQNAVHPEDRVRVSQPESESGDFREFELRLWDVKSGDWRWFVARSVSMPRLSGSGQDWVTSLHDIHEHKVSSDRREIVIGELRHRLKNLLTIIDALAKNSRSKLDGAEVEAFLKRFLGRLHALGAAADLVLAGRNVAVECGAIVRATLSPFIEENGTRFILSGPELLLSEETGGTLGLAIHEMATNALKYGALSMEGGKVFIRWSVLPVNNGAERIEIEWKERGGPRPVPPNREGFGTRLIRSVPARERSGEVQIAYDADGFSCRIAFVRAGNGTPVGAPARDAAE